MRHCSPAFLPPHAPGLTPGAFVYLHIEKNIQVHLFCNNKSTLDSSTKIHIMKERHVISLLRLLYHHNHKILVLKIYFPFWDKQYNLNCMIKGRFKNAMLTATTILFITQIFKIRFIAFFAIIKIN